MTDGKHDDTLPVTAELGGEGGSYGDGTMQAETFKGVKGNERVDPKRIGPEAAPGDGVRSPGREPDPIVKPPSEP